jgi:hypothetical protein
MDGWDAVTAPFEMPAGLMALHPAPARRVRVPEVSGLS